MSLSLHTRFPVFRTPMGVQPSEISCGRERAMKLTLYGPDGQVRVLRRGQTASLPGEKNANVTVCGGQDIIESN